MNGLLAGFLLGLSLILAIGAQNAFVLKQGLKKQHVLSLCLICSLSDALLINLGVFGFTIISQSLPQIEKVALYGGVLFLLYYGGKSFWASFKVEVVLEPTKQVPTSWSSTMLLALAFTWLNPHVYLDTVMLIGSISTQYPDEKIAFAAGATMASFVFFFSLGYGAQLLTPIFKKPWSWKILDFAIGVVMWGIAFSLVKDDLNKWI